mmetsp:Transcript_51220/g.150960  ORF Transcript_51220/g.150960 Transcript_51220/m.150960 type:complete len:350 (-) Transcript_51220:161-1210(-)
MPSGTHKNAEPRRPRLVVRERGAPIIGGHHPEAVEFVVIVENKHFLRRTIRLLLGNLDFQHVFPLGVRNDIGRKVTLVESDLLPVDRVEDAQHHIQPHDHVERFLEFCGKFFVVSVHRQLLKDVSLCGVAVATYCGKRRPRAAPKPGRSGLLPDAAGDSEWRRRSQLVDEDPVLASGQEGLAVSIQRQPYLRRHAGSFLLRSRNLLGVQHAANLRATVLEGVACIIGEPNEQALVDDCDDAVGREAQLCAGRHHLHQYHSAEHELQEQTCVILQDDHNLCAPTSGTAVAHGGVGVCRQPEHLLKVESTLQVLVAVLAACPEEQPEHQDQKAVDAETDEDEYRQGYLQKI